MKIIFLLALLLVMTPCQLGAQTFTNPADLNRHIQQRLIENHEDRPLPESKHGVRAALEFQQIISPNKALVKFGTTTYLYEGQTKGRTDDSTYWEYVIVTNQTHTYKTVLGGSKTVRVIRRMNPKEVEAFKKLKKTIDNSIAIYGKRTQKKALVIPVYYSANVLLAQSGEHVIAIPLSQLSKASNVKIKSWAKEREFKDKEKHKATIKKLRFDEKNRMKYKALLGAKTN